MRKWHARGAGGPHRDHVCEGRALALDGANKVGHAGLRDIESFRLLSRNPQHVELHGDPLESFDLEPPNEDDERRGVKLDE